MFPFTIVAIIGVGLTKRGIELLTFWEASKRRKKSSFRRPSKALKSSRTSSKSSDNSSEDWDFEEDREEEGLTKIQKGALAFVWASSGIYSLFTDKMLSKVQKDEVICSMREDLNDKLNIISVLMVIAFPILSLILWPVGHFVLDTLSCLKGIVIMSTRKEVDLLSEPSNNCCGDESDSCIETILIFGFTIIFLVIYPTSMLITEFYFSETETMFAFMLLKYCLGSMTLVLSPSCVLVIKRDIRTAAKDIYMKRVRKEEDGLDISLKDLVMKLEELRESGKVIKLNILRNENLDTFIENLSILIPFELFMILLNFQDDDKVSETELKRILELQGKM